MYLLHKVTTYITFYNIHIYIIIYINKKIIHIYTFIYYTKSPHRSLSTCAIAEAEGTNWPTNTADPGRGWLLRKYTVFLELAGHEPGVR